MTDIVGVSGPQNADSQAPAATPQAQKPCQWCGDQIPRSARVCRQCRNFQGLLWWARAVGVSAAFISLLSSSAVFLSSRWSKAHSTLDSDVRLIFDGIENGMLGLTIENNFKDEISIASVEIECQPTVSKVNKDRFDSFYPFKLPQKEKGIFIQSETRKDNILYVFPERNIDAIRETYREGKRCKAIILISGDGSVSERELVFDPDSARHILNKDSSEFQKMEIIPRTDSAFTYEPDEYSFDTK